LPEKEAYCKAALRKFDYLLTGMCLAAIKVYRFAISPLKPQVCRFYPSCSQYTYDAFAKYGFLKGFVMGAGRVLRCHPFNPGGYNPVE